MSNRRKSRQVPHHGKSLPSARIAMPTPVRTPAEDTFNYGLPADSWQSADEDEFDSALPQWRQFVARYPTVPGAIAAAAAGGDVSMFLHDMRLWGLTILDGPAGPQGRVVTYATSKLRALSVFSVLNDPDPEHAIATVCQTLDELVQAHGPFPSITAVAEPGGTPMPRFGWQTLLDASGWGDWDDFLRDYFASGIDDLQDLTDTTGKLTRDSALCAQHFRQAGLRVAICRGCALPLTAPAPRLAGGLDQPRGGDRRPVLQRPRPAVLGRLHAGRLRADLRQHRARRGHRTLPHAATPQVRRARAQEAHNRLAPRRIGGSLLKARNR